MSKRKYQIINVEGNQIEIIGFTVENMINNFEGSIVCNTELAYTITDRIDDILDMERFEVKHFFMDRAREFPCLIQRLN